MLAIFTIQFCVAPLSAQDLQADNMLLYQRAFGGWPKHINEVKMDYAREIFEEQKFDIVADSIHKDATIDNDATVREIRYLAGAYKKYKNPLYLQAVEKGIRYLLKAQYPVGGWPQFYPDSSMYRGQITFNDNAMMNVMNILQDTKLCINNMEIVNRKYEPQIEDAIVRGVECILKLQVRVNGKLTSWCAQYDQKTLLPATARKYELPSLSGNESVEIIKFLMRIENPNAAIKEAVKHGIAWFEKSKIEGYNYGDIKDSTKAKGRDRVIWPETGSVIWARFYDLETNQPFFSGRDGIKKWNLMEIEHERRIGYGWYGKWPKKLLEKEYPEWKSKLGIH